MRFGAPGFLPLLVIPAGLLILWIWQLWKRRADARAFMRRRQVPVNERVPYFGELLFWLFLIFAASAALMAQIGRASCRERGWMAAGGGALKRKEIEQEGGG